MRRPTNGVLTERHVKNLECEAEDAKRFREMIKDIERQLTRLDKSNDWLNYLGENAQAGLTEEQRMRLCEAHNTIKRMAMS